MVMGSNPNSDYNTKVKFPTEYRIERLYPFYYNTRRPVPMGIPPMLSYGGKSFDVTLTSEDLFGDVQNVEYTTIVIIRTGFSTHALNMGQRMVVLESSYTGNLDGSATLHVSQVPPNPAIFPPGPALCFVVVNNIPSVATQVMIGSGAIEDQPTHPVQSLPESKILSAADSHASSSGQSSHSGAATTPSGSAFAGSATPNVTMQSASSATLNIPVSPWSLALDVLLSSVLAGLIVFTSFT